MNFSELTLPDAWSVKRIAEAYHFTKKPRDLHLQDFEAIPFFPMETIPIGRKYPSEPILKTPGSIGSGTYFERGDLLLAKITPSFENGKQAIVKSDFAFGYGTTEVIPIKPINGESDIDYLFFLLLHPSLRNELAGQMEGSTGRQRLSKEILGRRQIPFPPFEEQRRIAAILSTVQRAIEQQEQLIALTTELKKALMHKLFTEGTRGEPQKETEIGLVPESWEVVELGKACVVQTGIAKGRKIDPDIAITLPYLRVANVQDGFLDLSEMKDTVLKKSEIERYLLKEGDVVLTEGGDLDKLGRGFIWHGQIEQCVHQNHIFAVRPDGSRLLSEYLAYQVQSPYGKAYFLSVAHKTTNLACINTSKLKGFPLLIPSIEEQREIADALKMIDRKKEVTAQKLEALKNLFLTLLNQLMTAQIRVNNIDLAELGLEAEAQP